MAKVRPVQIVAFAVAASAVACSVDVRGSEVSTREEKRFTVSATEPVELKLRTFDGTLVVRSWDKNEVLVEIERRAPDQSAAEALVVNQTQDGNKITIEAPTAENRRSVSFGVSQSVNFSVTLPRRVALEASTGDGGDRRVGSSGNDRFELGRRPDRCVAPRRPGEGAHRRWNHSNRSGRRERLTPIPGTGRSRSPAGSTNWLCEQATVRFESTRRTAAP